MDPLTVKRPAAAAVWILALGLALVSDVAWGQCVMCKAVAEDSAEDGSLGRGLNAGILYLMAIPYVILGFFAWMVFRKRKEAGVEGV